MTASNRILIIDDEVWLRMNLRALLEDLGYEVLEAETGEAGLALCARERPDIVLLDVRMPGADGFEICARLKADEALRSIPVIILSGMLEAGDKVRAFRAGAVDCITKPFQFEEVEARLRTHLALVHQREGLERANAELFRMNDRLRRSEALKGQFLDTMRRGLDNPLSRLLDLGLELEQGHSTREQVALAGRALTAEASDLDFTLRNIFSAAELEAGEAVPSPARVHLPALAHRVLDERRFEARAKELRVRLEAPETEAWADGDKLHLILANLVSNAYKFGPAGGTVGVRLACEHATLFLEVEDEGPGLRPEDQGLIFERFRQLDPGHAPGHGLGLAVVKGLVDRLDGTIRVDSRPGHGTRMLCALPSLAPVASPGDLDRERFQFGDGEEV